MTWDQPPPATWDSSFWDLPNSPPAKPKSKPKAMRKLEYFPIRIGNQIVWLRNFKLKLPAHATALALVAGEVTAILLDVDTAIYGLESYRGALGPAQSSCYQCIEVALYGDTVVGDVVWMGFTAPAGAPAAVANGCLKRLFTYIADEIKKSPGYNLVVGEDLGTEGVEPPPPPPGDTAPEFDLRGTAGHKLEVVWTKRDFDGVKLEFDRGTAGILTDIDLRPNYTLNWLPALGQSVIIKVRLRYIQKGEDFGNWSDWRQWTLTGE